MIKQIRKIYFITIKIEFSKVKTEKYRIILFLEQHKQGCLSCSGGFSVHSCRDLDWLLVLTCSVKE